jgi:hypothetical protein
MKEIELDDKGDPHPAVVVGDAIGGDLAALADDRHEPEDAALTPQKTIGISRQ